VNLAPVITPFSYLFEKRVALFGTTFPAAGSSGKESWELEKERAAGKEKEKERERKTAIRKRWKRKELQEKAVEKAKCTRKDVRKKHTSFQVSAIYSYIYTYMYIYIYIYIWAHRQKGGAGFWDRLFLCIPYIWALSSFRSCSLLRTNISLLHEKYHFFPLNVQASKSVCFE